SFAVALKHVIPEKRDRRVRKHSHLLRLTCANEQLAALLVEQAATIERLEQRVAELEAEGAELKRRLAQNSRNLSRPPSSDGLAKPAPKSLGRPSGCTLPLLAPCAGVASLCGCVRLARRVEVAEDRYRRHAHTGSPARALATSLPRSARDR